MSEDDESPHVGRSDLRRRIRQNLPRLDPSLRILAEDVLGLDSRIDWVAQDTAGQVVLVLLARDDEDGALLTRALAQRAWLAPRLRDWLQLAPQLEIRPDAPVCAILLAPAFGLETRAAAASLREGVVRLATYRSVPRDARQTLLLEALPPPANANARRGCEPAEQRETPPFRSGLSESDLGLTAAERRDLELGS